MSKEKKNFKLPFMDDGKADHPIIRIPDHSVELKAMKRSMDAFLSSERQRQIDLAVRKIEQLVHSVPNVVTVEHHHHFAKWSKRIVWTIATLSALLALACWVAYHLYSTKCA
ncbi:MAG: hypothetical protein AAGB30_01760 [Pedobacter sp.]